MTIEFKSACSIVHRLKTLPKETCKYWNARQLKLGSTCDSIWPGLEWICIELGCLALTLVDIIFARKSTQLIHRLATQLKSTQDDLSLAQKHRIFRPGNGFFFNLRERATGNLRTPWATHCKYLRKLNLLLLAMMSPFGQRAVELSFATNTR